MIRVYQRGSILALACAAQFLVVLDISVVNVALPSIAAELEFGASGAQWIVNAYALTFAGFLLLGGRLADIYGRRRVFLGGLALFAAASLAGGLAGSSVLLIAARAGQGLGAAALAPTSLTLLTTTFPEGAERTRALGIWTAVSIGGGMAGNLIGGVLTELLSWRAVLLINVPIGALAILVAARSLRPDQEGRRGGLDLPGAVLATSGLAALAFGVTRTQAHGWGDPLAVTSISAGFCGLAAFVLTQVRSPEPLFPLRLLRIRAVGLGNVALLVAGACLNPMWYFLTLYMQLVLGYGPLQAGLAFLPHTVLSIVASWRLSPWLIRLLGTRTVLITGALICAAGFLWQSRSAPDSGYLDGILGPAVFIGLGGGLLNTPITSTVTSGVPSADAGAASGLMNTTKQVGGSIGLAVLATVAAAPAGTDIARTTGYNKAFLIIAAMLVTVAALAVALPARAGEQRVPARATDLE